MHDNNKKIKKLLDQKLKKGEKRNPIHPNRAFRGRVKVTKKVGIYKKSKGETDNIEVVIEKLFTGRYAIYTSSSYDGQNSYMTFPTFEKLSEHFEIISNSNASGVQL